MALEEICRTPRGIPVMVTLTFGENVTDMPEAKKRWRALRERLRRRLPELRMAGCWQRQTRGAWHYHGVADQFIDVNWLRPAAVACGFGVQMVLRYVAVEMRTSCQVAKSNRDHSWSVARCVSYITRYVARDMLDDSVEAGVRVVDYFGRCRVATTAFGWACGFARVWRAGRGMWFEVYGEAPRWDDYQAVIELGWHTLTPDEQLRVEEESDAVFKWRNPDLVPF